MTPELLHEDKYLQILWDPETRIIGIDWKDATSGMTDEDFKAELTLFAKRVEEKKAPRVLIDVRRFQHSPSEEVGEWRSRNISKRYNSAGVKRFAFIFPKDAPVQSMARQSEGEWFVTQSFNDQEQATAWLTAS